MAGQELSQSQKQVQSQILAPQLRQSLKILQAPALELRHTILEELQTNPTLEELPENAISVEANTESDAPEEAPSDENEMNFQENYEVLKKMTDDWQDYFHNEASQQNYSHEDANKRQFFLDSVVSETSFQEHLLSQVKMVDCSEGERKALEFLIGSLDDSGFLTVDEEKVVELSGVSKDVVKSALEILKTFEPAGIGCRTVQESLLLQLEIAGKEETLIWNIIKDHYALLLRRRIPELAKKLHLPIETIQESLDEIGALDPAPGRKFKADSNMAIVPDLSIYKEDGKWKIVLNNDYIPRLQINPIYKRFLLNKSLSDKEKEYVRSQMKSGRFLIGAIEQRQRTIERIAGVVLELQKDFFENGVSQLHPLTMSAVAKAIGVHETTVSRAISNKFVKTPHGVYDFRFFFTNGLQSSEKKGVSNTSVKDRIQQIINGEDPEHPISDQEIVHMLAKEEISIARRTVAKYREELGIVSTNLRRQYS